MSRGTVLGRANKLSICYRPKAMDIRRGLTDNSSQNSLYLLFTTSDSNTCQAEIGFSEDAGPHMTSTVVNRDLFTILDSYAASDDDALVPKPEFHLKEYNRLNTLIPSNFLQAIGATQLQGPLIGSMIDIQTWQVVIQCSDIGGMEKCITI
jgi:hypothetical protein